MPTCALIDTATGAIIRRHDFHTPPPALSPAKGMRWVLDAPPAIDAATQTCTAAEPVTGAAVEYIVAPIAGDILAARANAQIRRQIVDMEARKIRPMSDILAGLGGIPSGPDQKTPEQRLATIEAALCEMRAQLI